MNILFYIIVPVYKTERYLDACVESVLKQTYENWQLILVDDGSPDKCGEICDSYAMENEKIHAIHQENKGPLAARSAAAEYVRQAHPDKQETYILHLDSDDSFEPDALKVIYDHIAAAGCDLLFFGMDRVHDGKAVPDYYQPADCFCGMITDKRELYNLVLNHSFYNRLSEKAVRFSLYDEEFDYSAYYSICPGEDLLQSLMFYKNCRKALFIRDVIYHYTVNPMSIIQNVTYESFRVDSTVESEVLRFIKEEKVMTDSDMKKYLDHCRVLMVNMIKQIAVFHVGYPEKKGLLEAVREDKYYAMLLSGSAKLHIILRLLKHRHYHAAVWIAELRVFCGKLYRGIKGHFVR